MNFSNSPVFAWRSILLAVATILVCTGAVAQWQWLDGSGRKVYSDTPPPPSIPEKDILKRAGPAAAAPVAATAAAPAAAPVPAATPQVSGRDEQLEAKKKQAEAQEQAQKKVEMDKLAKARQDNCERAKRSKMTLESGARMATTNAKGEREIMDDAARATEVKRINEIIQSNCGSTAR
jgi:type IV secretory pathway VirB10-like protein